MLLYFHCYYQKYGGDDDHTVSHNTTFPVDPSHVWLVELWECPFSLWLSPSRQTSHYIFNLIRLDWILIILPSDTIYKASPQSIKQVTKLSVYRHCSKLANVKSVFTCSRLGQWTWLSSELIMTQLIIINEIIMTLLSPFLIFECWLNINSLFRLLDAVSLIKTSDGTTLNMKMKCVQVLYHAFI